MKGCSGTERKKNILGVVHRTPIWVEGLRCPNVKANIRTGSSPIIKLSSSGLPVFRGFLCQSFLRTPRFLRVQEHSDVGQAVKKRRGRHVSTWVSEGVIHSPLPPRFQRVADVPKGSSSNPSVFCDPQNTTLRYQNRRFH